MEKSKKNLITQILWVIAIGIIVYFAYNTFNNWNVKENAKARRSGIEESCMEIAIEEANSMGKFLTEVVKPSFPNSTEKVQQAIEDTKNKKYQECVDIWGD